MANRYGSTTDSTSYQVISDSVKINDLKQRIRSNLQTVQKIDSQLRSNCELIGTASDSVGLRSEIEVNSTRARKHIEAANSLLTELNKYSCGRALSRLEWSKFMQQSEDVKVQHENTIRNIVSKCQSSAPPESIQFTGHRDSNLEASSTVNNEQHQLQSEMIEEKDMNASRLSLQADTERQMQKLTNDLLQINEIFIDLHQQVLQQGEGVDSIVDNTTDACDHQRLAGEELDKAIIYRRKARRKKYILLLLLVTFLTVLVIVLVLVFRGR